MPEIIIYITQTDAESIVDWINNEDNVAWIVKDSQYANDYRWKAVHSINEIYEGEYCIWKVDSGNLRIPSGSNRSTERVVSEPFLGWDQTLKSFTAEVPWFGAETAQTFRFDFKENGRCSENALGRSGFNWIGNYFKAVGSSAPDVSIKWWNRLRRYIKNNSTGISWPTEEIGSGRSGAYAFPEAMRQIKSGRKRDINP